LSKNSHAGYIVKSLPSVYLKKPLLPVKKLSDKEKATPIFRASDRFVKSA
jgi:hypothetical protein